MEADGGLGVGSEIITTSHSYIRALRIMWLTNIHLKSIPIGRNLKHARGIRREGAGTDPTAAWVRVQNEILVGGRDPVGRGSSLAGH